MEFHIFKNSEKFSNLNFWNVLGALCFAELGTVIPKSGAEYAYLIETFGKQHKFWGPLPAFVCSWVYIVILRPAEIAVIVSTIVTSSLTM